MTTVIVTLVLMALAMGLGLMLLVLGAAAAIFSVVEAMPWLLVLLVVIIVGSVAIFLARRYMQSGGELRGGGFTLHDLRQMHAAGEISNDEFERAKSHMIGRLKADAPGDKAKPTDDQAASTGNHDDAAH